LKLQAIFLIPRRKYRHVMTRNKGIQIWAEACMNEVVKSEVVPVDTMKAQRDSQGRAPLILKLGTRCEWTTSRPDRFNLAKELGYQLHRRLGGLQGQSRHE
jgi:hypothetical protein